MIEVRVEGAAQLKEGETQTFTLPLEFQSTPVKQEAFVLRRKGHWLAFLNECPHWSVELDLGDGHFFDAELDRIYCKNHGALFVLPSGDCETGPCLGRALTQYPARVEGEDVVVSL